MYHNKWSIMALAQIAPKITPQGTLHVMPYVRSSIWTIGIRWATSRPKPNIMWSTSKPSSVTHFIRVSLWQIRAILSVVWPCSPRITSKPRTTKKTRSARKITPCSP
ncbi:hypothetical protein V6Z11_A01G048500 [Gossypium hirsutum]